MLTENQLFTHYILFSYFSSKSPSMVRRHSIVTFTATAGSSKKSKLNRQKIKVKKKVLSKKRLGLKKIQVPDDIAKEFQPLEKVEKIAEKLKMNRTQVKGVLRWEFEKKILIWINFLFIL